LNIGVKRRRIITVIVMTCAVIMFAVARVLADDDTAHQYAIYCAKCHGVGGRGDGVYASKLHQRPRDFTDCVVMAKIPDATIVKAIEEGGAAVGLSNEMPEWQGALDDDEIAALAHYIRGFCTKPPASTGSPPN
jgi:mono/diheme cytochrome c family protein